MLFLSDARFFLLRPGQAPGSPAPTHAVNPNAVLPHRVAPRGSKFRIRDGDAIEKSKTESTCFPVRLVVPPLRFWRIPRVVLFLKHVMHTHTHTHLPPFYLLLGEAGSGIDRRSPTPVVPGAFGVFAMRFWRLPRVVLFLKHMMHDSGGVYVSRWADGLVFPAALALFSAPGRVKRFGGFG